MIARTRANGLALSLNEKMWLGDRAQVWCQDVLDLDLDQPVDAIVSTATLHWVPDHDRLSSRLASVLRPGGVLEVQCGGEGNIDRVRAAIDAVARDLAPELVGWSPWTFAGHRKPSGAYARRASHAP